MNDASQAYLEEKDDGPWSFKLFVAGATPASARAVTNLKRLAAEHLPKNTQIQIIDLAREWDAEDGDDVLAVPLLMRKNPPPPRRIIGDLANTERVLRTLDLPVPG
jgi:circadian clock protein KaiB